MNMIPRFVLIVFASISLGMVSCGGNGEDDGVIEEENRTIRIIEDSRIFSLDDMKGVGWKKQHELVPSEYPLALEKYWGYLNTKEVGVLIYSSADEAKSQGLDSAKQQTSRGEDGKASEGVDRISCRHAQGQSAVKNIKKNVPIKYAYNGSINLLLDLDDRNIPEAPICPNKYPTYRDITIIGNMVVMCESDGRNLSEPSTNCAELSTWLSE